MSDLNDLTPRFINTFTQFGSFENVFGAGAPGSAAWGTANRALYFPITIPFNFNAQRMYVANGGTATGNIDVGIYTLDGTRIWHAGSTAQAGTSSLQYFTISPDIILPPGGHYLAFASNSASSTVIRSVIGGGRLGGLLLQDTAFALPSTMSPAAVAGTNNWIVLLGLTSTSGGY